MPIVGIFVKMNCAQFVIWPIVPIMGSVRAMKNNLRALREGRGWTQEQAAAAMGTTRDQYVKLERGVAKGGRRLSDKWIDRAAQAYGVDPGEVVSNRPPDAPSAEPTSESDAVREVDIRAGLGGGGYPDREVRHQGDHADPLKDETWRFPPTFMRNEIRAPASRVIVIETDGDSMLPTISSGERVIVDTGHTIPSPDGIYALRDRYGGIVVKRLQVLRRGDPPVIRVISDNQNHSTEDVGPEEIQIVGRVLYGLKRF